MVLFGAGPKWVKLYLMSCVLMAFLLKLDGWFTILCNVFLLQFVFNERIELTGSENLKNEKQC